MWRAGATAVERRSQSKIGYTGGSSAQMRLPWARSSGLFPSATRKAIILPNAWEVWFETVFRIPGCGFPCFAVAARAKGALRDGRQQQRISRYPDHSPLAWKARRGGLGAKASATASPGDLPYGEIYAAF